MPGRGYSATGAYRYGFNGKENDNEVKGEGGQQDYGMRIYDPRLGRFLSVDPLMKSFPFYAPYQFAGNMPISAIDLDGQEPVSALRVVSKFTSKIVGVSWGWQYNAVSHTVGLANGIAVDNNGNVLAFTQRGGLATALDFLEGGKSTDLSLGISIGFSVYNENASKLQDLLGRGKSISGGVGFVSGAIELSDDGEFMGASIQLGLSIGSTGPFKGSASAQSTEVTGVILAKSEYDRFESKTSNLEGLAVERAQAYDLDQAYIAGNEKFPDYTNALWQSKGSGHSVSYEEVGANRYEIVFKTYFTAYAQQTVIAKQGLDPAMFREFKIEKVDRSGIFLTQDERGNYISEAYSRQVNSDSN